uniref:Uncharacterized protein n=1 Tax=Clandestinovirus TaxID=2831644 RepID=A0A8F8KLS0_9VIRU|nr:hypothetical protein KOM_12_466 [Clandestinovirus]
MKIARPGYVIQTSTFSQDNPIFALDLRNQELVFEVLSEKTLSKFKGYPDQTLSLSHVNYYDDRTLLRVNALIDDDHLLHVRLYYGNTLIATWFTQLVHQPFGMLMIDSLLISDEGNHIIVATNNGTFSMHIESLINKFVIPY